MSFLDEMINPKLDPVIAHQRMLEETLKHHNEDLKQKLLNDPTYSDQILSHLSRSAMTEKVGAKVPVGANFDKAISVIDKDDPRRQMLEKLQTDMPSIIKSAPFGENPSATIMKAVKDRSDASREDIYKYIQGKQGFFSKDVAPAEGYDEWEKKNPPWSSPISSGLFGAGAELASMPVLGGATRLAAAGGMLSKLAGPMRTLGGIMSMAPPIAGGLPTKLIGATLVSMAGMAGIDAISKASAASGHPLSGVEQFLAGIPVFGGLNAISKVGGKAVAGRLASMEHMIPEGGFNMTGKNEQAFGFAGERTPNPFETLASPGMQTTMQGGQPVESAIPGATVLKPAVEGRDIRAFADVLKEQEGLKTIEAAKLEKFKELTDQDKNDIFMNQNDPEKVAAIKDARFQANVKADAEATAAQELKTKQDILDHATTLQENHGLTRDEAITASTEAVSPTAMQKAVQIETLRKAGWDDAQIFGASDKQRYMNARTVNATAESQKRMEQMLPAVKDDVLPPATTPDKVSTVPKFDIKTGLPIQAGMPNQPALAEKLGSFPNNVDAIARLKVKASEPKINDPESKAAVEKTLNPGASEARKIAWYDDAHPFLNKYKTDTQGVLNSDMSATEKIAALNTIQSKAYDVKTALLEKHSLSLKEKDTFESEFVKIGREGKQVDTSELEKVAATERKNTTAGMQPESSVSNASEPAMTPEEKDKVGKSAQKEWDKIFGKRSTKDQITEAMTTNPDVAARAQTWMDRWAEPLKKAGLVGVAALAASTMLIPFSDVVGGTSEAHAGMFDRTATLVPKAFGELIQASGKPAEQMTQQMIDAGLGPPKRSENGHVLDWLMRSVSFAPKTPDIFPKTLVGKLDYILSLGTRDEIHFNARYGDGTRAPFAPGKEIGYRSQVIAANVDAASKTVNTILKDNGIEPALNEISDHFQPLVDKYHKQINVENPYWQGTLETMNSVLGGEYKSDASPGMKDLSNALKIAKKDVGQITDPQQVATLEVVNARRAEAISKIEELKPTLESFQKDYETYAQAAAGRWSTSRVALAVDGYGMKGDNPWLANMLSASERRAADEIAGVNRVFGQRMVETGHEIINGDYMHHPSHPSVNFNEDLAHASSIAPDGSEAMRLVNFFNRSAGSRLMIPDTAYVMGKYIPDAAKRIEISDMWKMGKPGGWDSIYKQMTALRGYDGALKQLDDIKSAFDPMDVQGSGKWLNRYAAFEVARLLTLSPSVSFKHSLKLMGNWTIFPSKVMASSTGEGAALAGRTLIQDMAGDAWKGKDNVVDLSRALTSIHHTYSAVSDMAPYELPTNLFDKFLTKWNTAGSAAVNGVERFDRGVTFSAAARMAQARGMTPEQAVFGLMDSVLKVNFLTGPNNPKWLKDPFIRTMMMFQGTPFKILEQRAMLAYQGGKDVANTLKMLNNIRSDVKTGEANFKWHMLNDELTRNKDVYGTAYSKQFLKQLMVLGTVVYSGKKVLDSNLWGHAIHVPGMQLGEKGINLGVNPLISAAYKTGHDLLMPKQGVGADDEFALSKFFNTWLGGTGFPAIAKKIAKLKDDDIPVMYRDNKLNYLFGIPKTKEQ